jgi:hypothetical protein
MCFLDVAVTMVLDIFYKVASRNMTLEVGTVVTATKSFSSVMVKADRREFVKIGSATGKFMDSVSVGQFVNGSVTVDTPNLKVKRE